MKDLGIEVKTAALYKYEDEGHKLQEMGVDITYDLYSETGYGYARHILDICKP